MRAGHFGAIIAAVFLGFATSGPVLAGETAVVKCVVDSPFGILLMDQSGNELADQAQFDPHAMAGKTVSYDLDYGLIGYPVDNPQFYISEDDVVFTDTGAVTLVAVSKQSGGATSGAGLGSGSGDPCE